jgi:hypothetical protein
MLLHPRRALRLAILAEWTLFGGALFIDMAAYGGVLGFFNAPTESDPSSGSDSANSLETVAVLLLLPMLLANLLGSAGLWLLLRWGRPLYAGTTVAFALSTLLLPGSGEQSALSQTLTEFAVMVSGGIIALSYYAPLHFRRVAP